MGAATPIGVLRALDRFDLIGWQGSTDPIARAILAGIGLRRRCAIRSLRRDLVHDRPRRRPASSGCSAGANFGGTECSCKAFGRRSADHPSGSLAVRDQCQSRRASVETVWGPIARLVVGGLLGPGRAALFRVASTLADSAQKPADLLAKAFYPEIVRMDLTSKKPWKLMLRGTVLASGLGAGRHRCSSLVGGRPLVGLLFGKDFLGAYPILMVMILAAVLGIFSFPLPPMLYTLGRLRRAAQGQAHRQPCLLRLHRPACWRFGVIGAAVSFVLANAAMAFTMLIQLRSEYRRVRAKRPPLASPSTTATGLPIAEAIVAWRRSSERAAGMNAAGHENRVEAHSRRAENVGLQPIANRQHLVAPADRRRVTEHVHRSAG